MTPPLQRYPRRATPRMSLAGQQRALQRFADARDAYEQRLGWPVTVDHEAMRITQVTGDTLSAITMPDSLGRTVLSRLVRALQPAAVLTGGPGRWLTFLTAPRPATAIHSAVLDQARVRALPDGTPVLLPIPGESSAEVQWIVPPQPRKGLPMWSVVVATARRSLPAVPIISDPTLPRA